MENKILFLNGRNKKKKRKKNIGIKINAIKITARTHFISFQTNEEEE